MAKAVAFEIHAKALAPAIEEVVKDIIEKMPEENREVLINTAEEDLIRFLHTWGRGIRNNYNLWQNPELVRATGKEHPDDASMVIIKAVWKKLQACDH